MDKESMTPSERVALWMGIDKPPSREFAMARVASRKVRCTGPAFIIDGNRTLAMPPGEGLRQPEGSTDWNDRYFLYVAEWLGAEIDAEVDAYRMPPPDYTQEGPHWPAVYAELERRGLCMKYRYHQAEAVKPRAISLWNEYPEESFDCSMAYAIATATPAQRLEALLRVIEEEEKHAG